MNHAAAKAALQFYLDSGVDVAVLDEAVNRLTGPPKVDFSEVLPEAASNAPAAAPQTPIMGKSDARIEAAKLAKAAKTIDELRATIATFDGIAIKKTATNLVFADGNPKSKIMLIGEAPAADEDRQGKPFVGPCGELLDKILASIGLNRNAEDFQKAVYLANLINWRPPGNRTPSPAEIEVSLPFIERHIQLVAPDMIILCGKAPAQALLGSTDSLSKFRKKFHDYLPQTPELREGAKAIPALVTYHPDYLLSTPSQKKAVWSDMLMLRAALQENSQ
jgi:DNA polymerase